MCLCKSIMIPSVHMSSIASVHPGRGILLCSLFSSESFFFFYFLGVFPDPMVLRSKVRDVGWVEIVKPSEANS